MGRDSDQLDMQSPMTVADVWIRATNIRTPPGNTLAAINLEYSNFAASVEDGDEVAFFPPVTGG